METEWHFPHRGSFRPENRSCDEDEPTVNAVIRCCVGCICVLYGSAVNE